MTAERHLSLRTLTATLLVVLLVAGTATGQSLRLRGVWSGAAISSSGDSMTLSGSLAQPLLGRFQAPDLRLNSGFWPMSRGVFTGVFGEPPPALTLGQNYPNPFNPRTSIPFALPHDTLVRLTVFDVRGRLVEVLADGVYSAGSHSAVFDASRLANGLYLYRLRTDGWSSTGRMMLVK